jgi:4-hydroxythreonine-4-phosphate dehydrogenase
MEENRTSGLPAADLPVIGITMGDFNGIGPEVILKTIEDSRITRLFVPVIYGSHRVINKYRRLYQMEEISFFPVKDVSQLHLRKINFIQVSEKEYEVNPGKDVPEAGILSYEALNQAAKDLKDGKLHAVVTCPINKANMPHDDFPFAGQTEFFSHHFGKDLRSGLMLLADEELKVAVVTGHVPLFQVPNLLTKELLKDKIDAFEKSLKMDFGILKPRIAVLGLNPHAGEQGKIGKEELDIINPVIQDRKNAGKLVFGPYPADGFFGKQHYKKFDGVLAMYHDQGLIPFKTLAFERGVNYTAGLSAVRTSPDHGTAYDLAGKNQADPGSLMQAIFTAIDIVKNRKSGHSV